jgi:NADH dehydrogenase/NADH:ubiquinone oxidoreductase subunit G
MSRTIRFTIDDTECLAEDGKSVLEAARDNGVYIPSLCYLRGYKPRGGCRICTVLVNGRPMAACTTPVTNGMKIDNNTAELTDARKAIIELMFVEGNHLCPSCVKSGDCSLQALAYRFQIFAPRFPYQFPVREIDTTSPKLILDLNRCINCRRCMRAVTMPDGKAIFGAKRRGHRLSVKIDTELGQELTDEQAAFAMSVCPVGSILVSGRGYAKPIGKRRFDSGPAGLDRDPSQIPTNGGGKS